jgi:acyl-CoA synthetase (AMP-forming)/AMP-acid ligase II
MTAQTTTALTIPGLVDEAARLWPDDLAIIDNDLWLTFSQLRTKMIDAAAAFISAGLQPGERAGLWAQNSAGWIIACLGLQAAKGEVVPLNTRFKGGEAEYCLQKSRAVMAVAAEQFLDFRYADEVRKLDLPQMRKVLALDSAEWDSFLAAATQAHRDEAERRLAALSGDDVCDIMFTSGTTGDPKGVVSLHGQVVITARLWARATSLTHGDRFKLLWPFFHSAGYKAGWVACMAVGAAALPEAVLDAPALLEKVKREQATFLPGPPTVFQTLLAMPDRDPDALKSVRVSVTGASAIAPSMIVAMREKLGIPNVLGGYGLTECCGTATMSSTTDTPEILTTTVGKAIDGVEVEIMDDDGNILPRGETGEVMIRGMSVMRGYLDDPEATSAAITPEGWLHSGDIGFIDEQGYLTITDRKKDMFITGGFNVYPAEVERMLLAHPALFQVAVIGIPDERLGEVCCAYVVPKPDQTVTEAELIEWSRERMANYKVPRKVVITDSLPTTPTGKVQKFKLPA